jgi:hypothetical protein
MYGLTGSITYVIPNLIGNPYHLYPLNHTDESRYPGFTNMPVYSSIKLPAPYVIPAQAGIQTTLTPMLTLRSFSAGGSFPT